MSISMIVKKAFLWALLVSLFLSVLQIISITDASFMGVHSSSFASEILRYYPLVAIVELLKIIGLTFVPVFLVCLSVSYAGTLQLRLFICLIFILSYFCFFFASVLQYPALYQDFFSPKLHKLIFDLSQVVRPWFFSLGSGILLLIGILFVERTLRRKLLLVFACFLALYVKGQNWSFKSRQAGNSSKTNVILIGIDSFRSDYLRSDLVPSIFALKQSASTVSFEDHIIGIPRTFPSWMEILTGKYAALTGIRHMFPGLLGQRNFSETLVSKLKDAGYETAVVSDFAGDIFPRFNAGFGEVSTPNFNLQGLTRMTIVQSFPLFLPLITVPFINKFFPDLLENPCFSDPEVLVSKSIEHLENSQSPVFLSIFFSNAHFPYAAPWPWYSKYSNPSYNGPYFFKKDPDLSQSRIINNDDIAQIRSLYSGSLSAIDRSLSRFFAYLKERNLWENSIIVITADHGEDLFEFDMVQGHGEHLRGENVLKVPLLIKTASSKISSNTISFTTRMIDLAPTVAGLLGVKFEGAVGLDLGPWIKDKKADPEISAYSETEIWFSRTGNAFFQKERLDYPSISSLLNLDPGGSGAIVLNPNYEKNINAAKHRSLVKGRFKLIYTPTSHGAFFKLFDRVEDPQNRNDIASKNPKVFRAMRDQLIADILRLEASSKLIEGYVVPF